MAFSLLSSMKLPSATMVCNWAATSILPETRIRYLIFSEFAKRIHPSKSPLNRISPSSAIVPV